MSQKQTVTINGRLYDALTGLPITGASGKSSHATTKTSTESAFTPQARASSRSANKVHSLVQRSQTLNRKHTKKPESIAKAPLRASMAAPVQARQSIEKSPAITKFAPSAQPARTVSATPQAAPNNARNVRRQMNDIAPVKHPGVVRANEIQAKRSAKATAAVPNSMTTKPNHTKSTPKAEAVAKPQHPPAKVVKDSIIQEALKNAPSKKEQKPPKKRSFFARYPRLLSITSASLALVMLGGYFTYLNMPNLSVRVAATQAGINASYPDYQPDGYKLNGPVAAENGKVQMKFASNAGPQSFEITQEKSTWDSSAVIDNLVRPKSNDSYVTTNERGLTIYTYDGNAAWVNGGILYTIEGDAPLSSEQIRRIATSL